MRRLRISILVLSLLLVTTQVALAGNITLPVRTLGERQTWRIDVVGENYPGGWPEYYINYKIETSFWNAGDEVFPFEMVVIVPYTNELRWIEARTAQAEAGESDRYAQHLYADGNPYPEHLAFQVTLYGPVDVIATDRIRFLYTDSSGSSEELEPTSYEPIYEFDTATPSGAQLQLLAPLPPRPESLEWFGLVLRSLAGGGLVEARWSFRRIPQQEVLSFADPSLEWVIRHKVELPFGPLAKDDVSWIRELAAVAQGIRSLAGIEHLSELEVLRLGQNAIDDVRPLAELRRLRSLDLSGNRVAGIAPLAALARLEELNLAGNHLESFEGLEALSGLLTLDISTNPVKSLENLHGLRRLRHLTAQRLGLDDLSGIAPLRQLRTLSLDFNEIESLAPLTVLKQLETLSLADNRIQDLEPLSALPNLRQLDVSGNRIESLLPLEDLTRLELLDASMNQVEHVEVLADMPGLKEADLSLNRIRFIGGWVEKQGAPRVWAMGNPLIDSWFSRPALDRLRGRLREERKVGRYTLRFYSNKEDPWRSSVELWDHESLVYAKDGFYFSLPDTWWAQIAEEGIIDLTADGREDLAIIEFTGGWHCCTIVHLFELEPELRYVASVYGGHETPFFTDLDGDGGVEVLVKDWNFAYWRTDFASSPAPGVVLRLEEGRFTVATEHMRTAPPSSEELQWLVEKVRRSSDWERYVMLAGQEPAPPPELWSVMLDLIYAGHRELAFEFFDASWPPHVPGKEAFKQAFVDRLQRSIYWEGIAEMLQSNELQPQQDAEG